jgi:hypothetical protein
MTIYRGFNIEQHTDGSFQWEDSAGLTHTGFASADQAMDAIDAYKRAQRESA